MSEDIKENVIERPNAMSKMDFAQLERLIMLDLKTYPYQVDHRYIGKYDKDDLKRYILTPEVFVNQVQLRYISKYLYNISSHYKRLVQYFASLLTLDYAVEPYNLDIDKVNIDKFKKSFRKNVDMIEMMNLKHEFVKVLDVAFRDDVFFGYVHTNNKDSFFIQQLNSDFCKASSLEDGIYNFAFDFNYFGVYPNRLHMYPQEFQQKWDAYKADGSLRWQELDPSKTICIKINETLEYPMPPFVGIFANILDIEDFKELRKTKTEIGNYKLLLQEIPIRSNSQNNNDYAVTMDQAIKFHSNISNVLPPQIGLVTTPMKLTVVDFERDRPDINRVADAEQEFWTAAGVSNMLFGAPSKGSIALSSSVQTDEMIAFRALRQLERWTNRYIKLNSSGVYKFRTRFLDSTVFNVDDVHAQFLAMAQNGMPVKSYIMASAGLPPSAMSNMMFLENEVFAYHEKMIPLASSHTTSNGEGGRPEKKVEDLSDDGATTKDQNKNADK